ncbi:MAG TPA: prepilin peptidase [Actinomycetota bacterium]|nr:prepilin peptidase [Actinomycetota bacterium]
MSAPWVVAFALVGLAIGSFLSVVVHRVPRQESVVRPRSRCPSCGTQLRARDNLPVVSYVLLRGRCRSCGARIPAVYPLLELATAALFAGAAAAFDRPYVAAVMAAFLAVLLALALIDARHRILPNRIVYPAIAGFALLVAAGALAGEGFDLAGAAVGFLGYGGGLLLVAIVSPRGMGMGDVKLAALIGLVVGSLGAGRVLVAAGVGILLGGVVAVGALLAGRGRKQAIPFGPFLAAGAAAAVLAGDRLARLYLDLVLR